MRKRTINYCFDKILWGIIMLLPIILYLAFIIFYLNGQRSFESEISGLMGSLPSFSFFDVMSTLFGWFSNYTFQDSVIYNVFYTIFTEYFSFAFDDSFDGFILWYAVYIMMVEFLHILVDVILLLPRICRKFLDKFKAEDC